MESLYGLIVSPKKGFLSPKFVLKSNSKFELFSKIVAGKCCREIFQT